MTVMTSCYEAHSGQQTGRSGGGAGRPTSWPLPTASLPLIKSWAPAKLPLSSPWPALPLIRLLHQDRPAVPPLGLPAPDHARAGQPTTHSSSPWPALIGGQASWPTSHHLLLPTGPAPILPDWGWAGRTPPMHEFVHWASSGKYQSVVCK
uniref:Uncharacterized protein n=1 Tax=Myotis myotis TaxID=51298 RepID=A0A7J7T660_MYOMY|nr:hypothetical protein mMyoMyo1_009232 [Myotis myotis]